MFTCFTMSNLRTWKYNQTDTALTHRLMIDSLFTTRRLVESQHKTCELQDSQLITRILLDSQFSDSNSQTCNSQACISEYLAIVHSFVSSHEIKLKVNICFRIIYFIIERPLTRAISRRSFPHKLLNFIAQDRNCWLFGVYGTSKHFLGHITRKVLVALNFLARRARMDRQFFLACMTRRARLNFRHVMHVGRAKIFGT